MIDMKVPLIILKQRVPVLHLNAKFKTDSQGFLPEMMEKMYNDRVTFKQRMIRGKKRISKN